jgi:hypothetical protein
LSRLGGRGMIMGEFHMIPLKINNYNHMKQLILNISDTKFQTFLDFIKTLDYVEVLKSNKSMEELQNSLTQVKMIKDGKLEKQSVTDFLNEL